MVHPLSAADLADPLTLKLALQSTGLGVWDWDVRTGTLTWSERAKAIYGFPPGEPVTYAQVRDATHPEDLPNTSAQARRALDPAVRANEHYEYRIVRPDGSVRWIAAHGEAVFDEAGNGPIAVRYVGTIQDITDEKRAQDSLRTHALVLDNMSEGVSLSTEDGLLVYTNPAEDRMFGYEPGELIGQHVTVQNAYPPEENARRVAEVISVLASEGFWEGEWLNRRKDGSAFITASRINAIEVGGRPHWLCVQRDISEARHAEDMRRRSEARLRLAVDAADVAIWDYDARTDSIRGSPELYELLGLPTDRPVSSDEIRAGYLPGERERVRADAEAALRRGERHLQNELRYRGQDGGVRHFLLRADLEVAESGVPVGALGVLIDITELKRTQEALRESQERLDLAVGAPGIGIFDWHIQNGTVIWSDQEERLFGLEPGEFEGDISGWEKRVVPEDRLAMVQALQAAMDAREPELDFQFRIRRADGDIRFIEGSGRFLYAEDGTPQRMVGVNIDVTRRARADEHQLILIRELNHRVKNTLAIVQGLARQSLVRAPNPAEANQAFNDRLQALALAHDVLTEVNWDKAQLREVARTIIRPYQTGRGAWLSLEGPPVQLRPQSALSLAMVLHELCTNAVKYGALSTDKGRVDIAWRVDAEGDASVLQFSWRERDGPAVVAPRRRGFGSRLIERGWTSSAATDVQMDYKPDGFVCTMTSRQGRADPGGDEQVW